MTWAAYWRHGGAATVFAVAGVAKLCSPLGAAMALTSRLPDVDLSDRVRLVQSLATAEALVGCMIVIPASRLAARGVAWFLVTAFAAVWLWDVSHGTLPDCGCFGPIALLGSGPVRGPMIAGTGLLLYLGRSKVQPAPHSVMA